MLRYIAAIACPRAIQKQDDFMTCSYNLNQMFLNYLIRQSVLKHYLKNTCA